MNKKVLKKKIPVGFKSAIVYLFATVFTRGLAIITTPIFTRIMSTDQVGMVNLYSSWYSMITVVSTLALTSGGFSWPYESLKVSEISMFRLFCR